MTVLISSTVTRLLTLYIVTLYLQLLKWFTHLQVTQLQMLMKVKHTEAHCHYKAARDVVQ